MDKENNTIYLTLDYDKYKPSSYRGLYLMNLPNKRFFSGKVDVDFKNIIKFAKSKFPKCDIGYLSCIENFLMDSKGKYRFDRNMMVVKSRPRKPKTTILVD